MALTTEGLTMAELTTTSGEVIDFDPVALTAISDMDPDSGAAVTCVYGIEGGVVQTVDPVTDLLQRLHLANKVAKLTRPDASPIWIVAAAVTTLRAPLPGEYAAEVKAVVAVTGLTQGVAETLSEAQAAIDAAGGHL